MRTRVTSFFVVFLTNYFAKCLSHSVNSTRVGKLFSAFQVVTFPNIACSGSGTRVGTCFTSGECSAKGGTASGTCAQGFGVCCTFTIGCGSTTSQNCTYLVQSTTTNPISDPCIFTLCKECPEICRIRLDFSTFSIAGPPVGTTVDPGVADLPAGLRIGDCLTDSFILSSPGNTASPVICGFNSGQHMIVDASNDCNQAIFNFGGTSSTRQFDIKVTQYVCGDENGGPDGCLQYFTGNTGQFASFNFPTSAATVGDSTTHLSNQCYTMCFRQELGKCAICFNTVIEGTAISGDQGSFGLSLSSNVIAEGTQDLGCSVDYLQIPGAERDAAGGMFVVGQMAAIAHVRICGRFFSFFDAVGTVGGVTNMESICTQQRPFRVVFKTDEDEETPGGTADVDEQGVFPGGIIGFYLNYALQDC